MAPSTLQDVLQHLRCVWAAKASRDLTDSQLLERFLGDQDEAAFAVLMHRHGPLVLGVCRRLTGDSHIAEDAFQGTFMVLARRAASIRKKASLASWLYGVAQHIAARAKAQAAARRVRERRLTEMPGAESQDEPTCQELQGILDAEISSLPEKYRAPIVLCYLEGKNQADAAGELHCPKTTFMNRLNRGRELLRRRLVRRGVTLSATALASTLSTQLAAASVTARLTLSTVKSAMNVASGLSLAAAGLSARAVVLAQVGLKATVGISGKVVALVMMLGMAVSGAGLAGYSGWQEREVEKPSKPKNEVVLQTTPPKKEVEQKKDAPAVDLYGDPLPVGAMARLGTTRFRAGTFTSALAFSPDDKILAAVGDRGHPVGALWVWDAATGRTILQLPHSPFERSMAFSPDGKTLFTGDAQGPFGRLRLIDVATGNVLHRFERPEKESMPLIGVVAFSPDGKTVAAGGGSSKKNSRIFIWDIDSGKQIRNFFGDREHIWTIAFSPDSRHLATGGDGRIICIWDVATGKILRRLDEYMKRPPTKEKQPGSDGQILFLSFSADGKTLASLGPDSITRLWDFDTGKVLHRLKGDRATMRTLAFSKDGRLVATGGRNGFIHMWDASTGKEIRTWHAHQLDINSLAFSHDGTVLASSGQGDAVIKRWDTSTGKEIGASTGPTGTAQLLRFLADGKTLISAGRDGRAIEWDLKTLQNTSRYFGGTIGPAKDGWHVERIDLSPDGMTIATAGNWWTNDLPVPEATIRFFDAATGKETQSSKLIEKEDLRVLKYSPDGSRLVSVSRTGETRIWDVLTSKELHQFAAGPNSTMTAAWSPDGKRLALPQAQTNIDGTIALWDVAENSESRRWDTGHWHVEDLLFSPDGRKLVSTALSLSDKLDFRVWDAESGTKLAVFNGIEEDSIRDQTRITSLGFSPNSRVLAVGVTRQKGDPDKRIYYCKVHLFDMLSMQEIRKFDAPQGTIWSLAFGVDGRMLATAGADAAILLWDLGAYAKSGDTDVDALWSNLAGDAPKADRGIWNLAAVPKASVPMLNKRMPSPKVDAAEIAKLIFTLDSSSFADRQKATQALENLGESAEAAVRKHLEGKPSLEVRQRLDQFLKNRDKDAIRKLRAIEVLELIGTVEARQLLETLAKEAPNPRVAEGAAGAVARLAKRGL